MHDTLCSIRPAIVCACLLLLPHPAMAGEPSIDPLSVIQMNPVMMRYLDIEPGSALPGRRIHHLAIRQRFASIFLYDHLPKPTRYLADMEMHVTELHLRTRLGRTTELQLTLPAIQAVSGVLDGFLHNYHKALHLPNGGRELRPNNQYAYLLAGGWNSTPGWEMGNIVLGMQHALVEDGGEGLSLRASLKLPTGNRARGWDSGTWDAGLGLIGSRRWQAAFVHLEADCIHPFGSDTVPLLASRTYLRGAFTLGWRSRWAAPLVTRPLTAIVQLQGGTSPYRHTGILALDQPPVLIAFGLRWQSHAGTDWQFAFTENVTQYSTQDFSLSLGCDFL